MTTTVSRDDSTSPINRQSTLVTTADADATTKRSQQQHCQDERYESAVKIAHSFQKQDFKPAWFATNRHVQTIFGGLYRKYVMYNNNIFGTNTSGGGGILSMLPSPLALPSSSTITSSFVNPIMMMKDDQKNPSSTTTSTLSEPAENHILQPLDTFHWDERQRIETDDNDFFHVDWKCYVPTSTTTTTTTTDTNGGNEEGKSSRTTSNDDTTTTTISPSRPVVVICHGLETNSQSPLAQDMAIAFNKVGLDVACVNFRGCSGEPNLTIRAYHLSFYDDLLLFCKRLNDEYPTRRLYLSGFSLGAGVITKLLGDLGNDVHKYNIVGAAVNAVPMDNRQCSSSLNGEGFTKSIYGNRLLQSMQRRTHEQYDALDFPFERDEIDQCQSIMDFENLLIAPTFGFDDAWDYYDKSRTIDVLDRVSVPQLIVQALDDPFFVGLKYPSNDPNIAVNVQYTTKGGHCGYVFHTEKDPDATSSWMPFQLARFLSHVEEQIGNEHPEEVVADLSDTYQTR